MLEYSWLILVCPLLGLIVNLLFGWRKKGDLPGIIASTAVGGSFLLAVITFWELLRLPPDGRLVEITLFRWINVGALSTEIALQLDPLSMVMVLVVTGVSFIIHIYAIGYMHGDEGYTRFFIYLNLFVFAMLLLVTANNFLMMFIGWEGVGLCSYLLIGFWYGDHYNAFAGRKAFIVNRIGDFGFLLAIFLIYVTFHTLDFTSVLGQAAGRFQVGSGLMTAIALLLFLGATGKSAQIPLYVWLPDAMAGPTPVSALIHAATMVTAGVYMVARTHVIFTLAPAAAMVVAFIGALTALYAATIGLTQFDIKRVLAYSTISQLGYMFMGVGVGAFAAGIFHLMTHAFFKALLFMAAGSVIHALGNQNDMRNMGGLKDKMPITYWTMLIAALAIAGIPGFSGFFSKDEILWQAFSGPNGGMGLWLIGAIAAGLTTFYMFRLIFMTFYGAPRMDAKTAAHVHESPKVMTVPLIVLAVLSIIGGYVGIPAVLGAHNRFDHFLAPVFAQSQALRHSPAHLKAHGHSTELILMGIVLLVVLVSFWLAVQFYLRKTDLPQRVVQKIGGLYRLVFNKYYVDEIYERFFTTPLQRLSETALWQWIDTKGIDGAVNGVGLLARKSGNLLSRLQTGFVQNYALALVVGISIVFLYLLL